MFSGDQQIGFARVVTDYAVFAYLADVFILPAFQGSGRGKLLVKTILEHDELQNIRKWTLATKDAHQLYSKFGFMELADPAKHMELKQPYPIESDD